MGYARYVGRVGGLAVALGVGVAVVTTPGAAWAEPTDNGSSNSSNSSSDSSSDSKSSSDSSSSSSDSSAGSSSSSSAGSDTGSSSSSTTGESSQSPAKVDGDDAGSTADGSGTAAVGDKSATGSSGNKSYAATVTDKKSGSDTSATAVRPTKPKRSVASAPSDTDARKGEPVSDSTPEIKPKSEPVAAVTVDEVSVVDAAPQRPSLSVSKTEATTLDSPRVESAQEPVVSRLSSTVLSAVGLAPSADGDIPEPAGDSPVMLAGLAAFRRQTQQALTGDEALARSMAEPSQSSLMLASVDAGAGEPVMLMAAAVVNSAPSVPVQPTGIPDPVSGVVTGAVIASDPDGNALTYTVTGAPTAGPLAWATAKGTVKLNPTTGAYTYTPTQDARLAAGATSTADVDSFTVAVSDGQQSTTAPVSVYVSPTQFAQTSIAVGNNPSAVAVSPVANDPRMYVANTGSGTVSVINTATGQRIDANSSSSSMDIAVGSSPSALAVSADGTRLYVANTGSGTVSVIDTTTTAYTRIDANSSIFSTDISVGSSPSALAVSADGKRLYVANRGSNTVSVVDTSTYKVIDTDTGVAGVNSIAVGSSPSALVLNGTRLYVANRGSNTVSVIDTTTNKVIDTDTKVVSGIRCK
jgi:YVTN family beta-propeller protein